MTENHLHAVKEKIDIYPSNYNNFIVLGDFNIEMEKQQFKAFCYNYRLKSLIRQLACYKSPKDPTCLDLILTNAPQKISKHLCFQKYDCQIFSYEKDFQEIKT